MSPQRQEPRTSQQQSPEIRLVESLNSAFDKIFIKAGKDLMRAKSHKATDAIKAEAKDSINRAVDFWRKMDGAKEVSKALKTLHLSEFDE